MNCFSLDFPYFLGAPAASAQFRQQHEDFVVTEVLGFEPQGEGEHIYLDVSKRDDNTPWVAKQIAKIAGVKLMDVGYSGLKDRRALTRQWFSVYLPKQQEIDWSQLNCETIQFHKACRHPQKLRRGQHQSNQFIIRLRDVQGEAEAIDLRLQSIAAQGVPNYFGEQRFGRDQGNLHKATSLLDRSQPIKNPQQRGMVISAARSWLFNLVLAQRVSLENWQRPLAGEPTDVATGPLWGRGRLLSSAQAAELEAAALADWQHWCEGLEHCGLSQERRALALLPQALEWRWEGSDLVLSFGLPPGQFATSVLREVCRLELPADS